MIPSWEFGNIFYKKSINNMNDGVKIEYNDKIFFYLMNIHRNSNK